MSSLCPERCLQWLRPALIAPRSPRSPRSPPLTVAEEEGALLKLLRLVRVQLG